MVPPNFHWITASSGIGQCGKRTLCGATSRDREEGRVSAYARSKDRSGEYLDELRPGHPPFRAPKRVYDAAIDVLLKAREPLAFERWREGLPHSFRVLLDT